MKKYFLMMVACASAFAANAQTQALSQSKLSDNWYVGVNGGGVAPAHHYKVLDNLNGQAGLTIGRYITPVYGLSVEGNTIFGLTNSATVVDQLNVTLMNNVNLNNLFAGYKGEPRKFEIVARAGAGWGHTFMNGGFDANQIIAKAGLSFNINVTSALQININPEITWALTSAQATCPTLNSYGTAATQKFYVGQAQPYFNLNNALLGLNAGITYKFKNSNGTHNFTYAKLYDQAEIDNLNAKLNEQKAKIADQDKAIKNGKKTIKDLEDELNECKNRKVEVKQVTVDSTKLAPVVIFDQGKTTVNNAQMPSVSMIATYMKSHKNANVRIKGYASPEGSAEINEKIAQARAEAVKTILVKKYKIKESRLEAKGMGVTDELFSENDWNRVATFETFQK